MTSKAERVVAFVASVIGIVTFIIPFATAIVDDEQSQGLAQFVRENGYLFALILSLTIPIVCISVIHSLSEESPGWRFFVVVALFTAGYLFAFRYFEAMTYSSSGMGIWRALVCFSVYSVVIALAISLESVDAGEDAESQRRSANLGAKAAWWLLIGLTVIYLLIR